MLPQERADAVIRALSPGNVLVVDVAGTSPASADVHPVDVAGTSPVSAEVQLASRALADALADRGVHVQHLALESLDVRRLAALIAGRADVIAEGDGGPITEGAGDVYAARGDLADSPQRADSPGFDLVMLEGLHRLDPDRADSLVTDAAEQAGLILLELAEMPWRDPDVRNVASPAHWALLLGRLGFFRDLEGQLGYSGVGAALYRRRFVQPDTRPDRMPAGASGATGLSQAAEIASAYEDALWRLRAEARSRRQLNLESREEVAASLDRIRQLESKVSELAADVDSLLRRLTVARGERNDYAMRAGVYESQAQAWAARWAALEAGFGWGALQRLQALRGQLAPPGSVRDQTLEDVVGGMVRRDPGRIGQGVRRLTGVLGQQVRGRIGGGRPGFPRRPSYALDLEPVRPRLEVEPSTASVDVVVCVHNALDDVRRCLTSVTERTDEVIRLIVVDDGSGAETAEFLRNFEAGVGGVLSIRNDEARGYTFAANQGLRASTAEYVVLLNSDTEVTTGWLSRMLACAESDANIGIVGPLSNTATFQSVPEVVAGDDWAPNRLPDDVTLERMAEAIATHSARAYPRLPVLNGFCLLIKRAVLERVGYFDEEAFAAGYGEENDYALRAAAAGFELAVADDAYVYHAMGRSYTDERRKALTEGANWRLLEKHGQSKVDVAVAELAGNRVMAGIRAHAEVLPEQVRYVERGKEHFAGKRLLFLLPAAGAGGGAVTVVFTSRVFRRMGLDVVIFNEPDNREAFEAGFPDLEVPVIYDRPSNLSNIAADFDAAVATAHHSVRWLVDPYVELPDLRLGYLVQDFEPYFYPSGSAGELAARHSYDLIPGLVRLVTTRWIQGELEREIGVPSVQCGAAVDVDLFRPRPRSGPSWPERPVRVAAMVRPESAYRGPEMTMRVLREIHREFGPTVEILIYGTTAGNPGFEHLPRDFAFELLGKLSQARMARLFNEVDIFADFSRYQAYGMAAVEAMCCGVATIVPVAGGTDSYARSGANCLAVDTSDMTACHSALRQLVSDHDVRQATQREAMRTGPTQHPEGPAYKMLEALFANRP